MRTFALIGHPLGHSFSQRFFSEMFARQRIDAEYLNFDIPDIDLLPRLIEEHPTLDGFNVTIPYKQSVIPYLDSIDPIADSIGAVNVVRVCRENGTPKLRGYNTDAIGFSRSVAPFIASPNDTTALVLGTGGASKAVHFALQAMGMTVVAVSRTPGDNRITYDNLTGDIMQRAALIVNATPLGTSPATDSCPPIPYDLIDGHHLLVDLVYNPAVTRFMSLGAEKGATVRNGLCMLQQQALEAWNIWNNDLDSQDKSSTLH